MPMRLVHECPKMLGLLRVRLNRGEWHLGSLIAVTPLLVWPVLNPLWRHASALIARLVAHLSLISTPLHSSPREFHVTLCIIPTASAVLVTPLDSL